MRRSTRQHAHLCFYHHYIVVSTNYISITHINTSNISTTFKIYIIQYINKIYITHIQYINKMHISTLNTSTTKQVWNRPTKTDNWHMSKSKQRLIISYFCINKSSAIARHIKHFICSKQLNSFTETCQAFPCTGSNQFTLHFFFLLYRILRKFCLLAVTIGGKVSKSINTAM